MAQTEASTVRGLTGSPRAEEGGGGNRAAPGTGKRRLSGTPAGRRWRVGNRGGDQGRSRHRRAPAFPTPPSASPPRLTPPLSVDALPGPRLQPPSGSAPGRPLPAAALETPPPGAPPRRARPAPACLQCSRERAPCASRFAAPRPRGLRRPSGSSAPGLPRLDTSLYQWEKRWGPDPDSRRKFTFEGAMERGRLVPLMVARPMQLFQASCPEITLEEERRYIRWSLS
ncbi:unnamed protein product [Rangifer tarandus platyrhynchus]|uniref:Uncharacterized protein n=1 Tax=Rangifer tarandus platyrhynchus TaxID=3082113 RepID=A0AC59ZM89_RANTA